MRQTVSLLVSRLVTYVRTHGHTSQVWVQHGMVIPQRTVKTTPSCLHQFALVLRGFVTNFGSEHIYRPIYPLNYSKIKCSKNSMILFSNNFRESTVCPWTFISSWSQKISSRLHLTLPSCCFKYQWSVFWLHDYSISYVGCWLVSS